MFFHIEIMTVNGTTTQAIYAHATKAEAVAAYHYALYYQMNNAECTECTAMVVDKDGAVYCTEKYVKPAAA